jgi:hypothetical protein
MASNNIQTKIRNYCNSSYTAIYLNKLGDMLILYKDPPSLLAIQLQ